MLNRCHQTSEAAIRLRHLHVSRCIAKTGDKILRAERDQSFFPRSNEFDRFDDTDAALLAAKNDNEASRFDVL